MDKLLNLIGLCKKAGKLSVGEEPVAAEARARKIRLLLIANDAAPHSVRRARYFADTGQCLSVQIPYSKAELGASVGRSVCAMLAVCDIGFAEAIAVRLAQADEKQYSDIAAALHIKAQRAAERRREQEQHEKNVRSGRDKKKKLHGKQEQAEPTQEKSDAAPPAPMPRKSAVAPRDTKRQRGSGGRSVPKKAQPNRNANDQGKQRTQTRFSGSRPVKKGKGSDRKQTKG